MINKKVKAALMAELSPIVCVGETLSEREQGKHFEVVREQLELGLEGLTKGDMKRIIIAYEPVWAIGTGKTATPDQAQQMHEFIRKCLIELHGEDVAEDIKILYGGSVKPDNIKDLMKEPDIDGALVGGASLQATSFAQIINYR
jgi:triosephosphate isomerase